MNYNTTVQDPQRFPVFAPGIYEAEVIDYEDGLTSQKGHSQAKLKLKVYDTNSDQTINIFDYLTDTETMLWKIKAFMQAVRQTWLKPLDLEASKGILFQVVLKEDEYKGQKQNKVDGYFAYEKEGEERTIKDEVEELKLEKSQLPF